MIEKCNEWKLAELFFKRPLYRYHFRELCRLLGWSPTKLRTSVEILKKHGVIEERREKNLKIFSARTESEAYRKLKTIYNLEKAIEIADFLERKLDYFEAIILFGSASTGQDTEKSDFDICIIGAEETDINLSKFEKDIERRISLLFADVKDLKRKNLELLNNIINGFVLKGYLEVV